MGQIIVKANIMPTFKSDMTILLKLISFLWFFMFFDQKIRAVKKHILIQGQLPIFQPLKIPSQKNFFLRHRQTPREIDYNMSGPNFPKNAVFNCSS